MLMNPNQLPPAAEPEVDPNLPQAGYMAAAGMEESPADTHRLVGNLIANILYSEEAMPQILDALASAPIAQVAPGIVFGMLQHVAQEAPAVSERDLFGDGKVLDMVMNDLFDMAEQAGIEIAEGDYEAAMRNAIKMVHRMYQNAGGGEQQAQPPMGDGGGMLPVPGGDPSAMMAMGGQVPPQQPPMMMM